jgi:hypothetical protein
VSKRKEQERALSAKQEEHLARFLDIDQGVVENPSEEDRAFHRRFATRMMGVDSSEYAQWAAKRWEGEAPGGSSSQPAVLVQQAVQTQPPPRSGSSVAQEDDDDGDALRLRARNEKRRRKSERKRCRKARRKSR